MKIICSICLLVMGHKAPYEDHRVSHSYCAHCYRIIEQYDYKFYVEYSGGKATIKPHKR